MSHLYIKLSLIGVVALNSACAPINTQFSCSATAKDRCLSIEEVNAMTEVDEVKKPAWLMPSTQSIWIAPKTDDKGIPHTHDGLLASTHGVQHVG